MYKDKILMMCSDSEESSEVKVGIGVFNNADDEYHRVLPELSISRPISIDFVSVHLNSV